MSGGCKPGAHLGGIRTLEDLRLRCVCPADDDCWHLRTARGRPMPLNLRHAVSIHGVGQMTATRAAWMLAGKNTMKGRVIYRVCESYDCVNPAHLKQGTRGDFARYGAAQGRYRSAAQIAPLLASTAARRKATPEIVRYICESPESAPKVAPKVGMSAGHVNVIRRQNTRRPASVFTWGNAAARACE